MDACFALYNCGKLRKSKLRIVAITIINHTSQFNSIKIKTGIISFVIICRSMMSGYHDNWERLVDAVLLRDHLRQLSFYDDSETPSSRSFDSDFTLSISSSSRIEEPSFRTANPSPLHQDSAKSKLNQQASKGRNKWRKGLSILSYFSLKNRKGREPLWDMEQRAINLHSESDVSKQLHERAEWAKRRAEDQRLRQLYTLKGHIESVMKTKGLDFDSLSHYYTV